MSRRGTESSTISLILGLSARFVCEGGWLGFEVHSYFPLVILKFEEGQVFMTKHSDAAE